MRSAGRTGQGARQRDGGGGGRGELGVVGRGQGGGLEGWCRQKDMEVLGAVDGKAVESREDGAIAASLEAVGGGRRVDREQARDVAVLAWAARFRFVTIGALAVRWQVTEQRMRARVRRLEREGLVLRVRRWTNHPTAIYPSERGLDRLGLAARARPRFDGRFGHELAVIKRVLAAEAFFREAQLEATVFTERDARRAEADAATQFAIEVRDAAHRRRRHWPDYVVATGEGSTAVELEFSAKATVRLRSIVRGYLRASAYEFVDFVLLEGGEHDALRRRLGAIIATETREAPTASSPRGTPRLRMVPWSDPLPALHAGIAPFPPLERGVRT